MLPELRLHDRAIHDQISGGTIEKFIFIRINASQQENSCYWNRGGTTKKLMLSNLRWHNGVILDIRFKIVWRKFMILEFRWHNRDFNVMKFKGTFTDRAERVRWKFKISSFWPEKVNFRSQILECPSIGQYWNIFGVLPENVILTFFRTC